MDLEKLLDLRALGGELAELYKDSADLVVNAGILENKMPSTLYDCIENKILRQGSVHINL